MARERTPTGEVLIGYAEAVDASRSWQFMGITGSLAEDHFIAWAIGRGPRLPIDLDEFGDIADKVTLTHPEVDGDARKVHIARYAGDVVGLELFRGLLTTTLDGGTEGEIDMLYELGGPMFLLGSVISGNQFAEDFLGLNPEARAEMHSQPE